MDLDIGADTTDMATDTPDTDTTARDPLRLRPSPRLRLRPMPLSSMVPTDTPMAWVMEPELPPPTMCSDMPLPTPPVGRPTPPT